MHSFKLLHGGIIEKVISLLRIKNNQPTVTLLDDVCLKYQFIGRLLQIFSDCVPALVWQDREDNVAYCINRKTGTIPMCNNKMLLCVTDGFILAF